MPFSQPGSSTLMKPAFIMCLLTFPAIVRAETLYLGDRLELFADDYLIQKRTEGVSHELIRPEPREVVLNCDAPWEGNTCGYFGIFQDGEVYRLYYRGWKHDPATQKQLQDEVTCYAESRDGIHFEKPNLGLIEWEGSKENNIIWSGTGSHNFTAMRDWNGHYRAVGSLGFKKGLLAFESVDGKVWKQSRNEPIITNGAFDSQNLVFWDPHRAEYRAYWRIFSNNVRAIRTATSQDFVNWDNEADITFPEGTANEHLYTNAVQPYFRAPHLYLGFPTRYLPKQGQRVEPVFMISRDGVKFHRRPAAVIPEDAPDDRAGNRSNYMAWGMVQLPGQPDEISVYGTESYYGPNPGRLRRFVYGTDRFVALRGSGEVTTKLLRVYGSELTLNYAVRPGGSLRLEVVNKQGQLTGKSEPLTGNAIAGRISWETKPVFTGAFQIRFLMKDADVYSIRFGPEPDGLIEEITKETVRRNRDGKDVTWFHPRACRMPDGKVLMNLQEIGGSDYFGHVHWSESSDLGNTWTTPEPIAALARDPVKGHEGLMAGVCDVTPQYHPNTGTVLALGHVVFYRGAYFARNEQLSRYPVYAVRQKDGSWAKRKILKWDDPRTDYIYSNNCGQRVVMPNGDIMMSFTFGSTAKNRMVAGVRCTFDGEELKVAEVGKPLEHKVGRGLLEPSVTRFNDRFYMTIRAEDGRGYVAMSDDGVNYEGKTAWAWEDGTPLGMSTTQQHWLTHSDGLFLVYTRWEPSNVNVTRWRSPLWVAQVHTEKRCLIRDTERVVLPMMGDGVNTPDDVALMGNFNITNVTPDESWVTVGEWMPRRKARGDMLLARIRWSKPNRLVAPQQSERR